VTLGGSQTRFYTSQNGGFSSGDIDVYVITVPASAPAGAYYRFAGAEYGDQPSSRIAAVSASPCDLSAGMGIGGFVDGNTITIYARIGQSDGYYPGLSPGGTYYFNVANSTSATCGSSCNMYFDFVRAQ